MINDNEQKETIVLDTQALLQQLEASTAILNDADARIRSETAAMERTLKRRQAELNGVGKEREKQVVAAQFSAEVISYANGLSTEVDLLVDALQQGFEAVAYLVPSLDALADSDKDAVKTAVRKILGLRSDLANLQRRSGAALGAVPNWPDHLGLAKPRVQTTLGDTQAKLAAAVSFSDEAVSALQPLVKKLDL